MNRVYLDWNATTPLGAEARAAMEQAMDVVGNPSSVHGEGRAARAIVERARAQVASAYGCGRDEIVFTSSATEAAALAMHGHEEPLATCGVEHDCVDAWGTGELAASPQGQVAVDAPERSALQGANSETGILQDLPSGLAVTDSVQVFGKVAFSFNWSGAQSGLLSAHKIGGPKGVGALVLQSGQDVSALLKGGGQEMGRRSGTENVIGIAGFGAAAEAAQRALEDGVWEQVEKLRNILESALHEHANETIFIGKDAARLHNTACFATPGWKGETQVMQMDLAGFAISAGSACSSGKVNESRVLKAMGYDQDVARSAVRVSLGPSSTEADVLNFARAWGEAHTRWQQRAA